MAEEQYDIIIIGSGIGGLASSVILSKHGYKVLVLEKNHQIGGALQVFSRDKCVFDTGVHYIGGLDKGQNLYRMFKYLGIYDRLKLRSLDREGFDRIRMPNGEIYQHGQGYANFIQGLVNSFPKEETAIRAFCAKIKEVCDFFPLYNLEIDQSTSYYNSPEILSIGAWDYISNLTENELLRNVLLGSGALYAGDAKSTPLYVVALIMNSYINGSYRLVDGGSQIARELTKELRSHGGKILKHKEVVSAIYTDDSSIECVICSDGSSYRAKHFISNMHPAETIRIFGDSRFRPAFRERIKKLKNTVSSFMMYASLKEDSFPYFNYNMYDFFVDDTWQIVDYDRSTWPQMIYLCTPASSKSETHAESICLMTYMSMDEVREWENTFNTISNPSDRAEAYDTFKREKEEQILVKLEQRYPGIRACIKNTYSSTPLTYKDYLATPEGSLYGIMKDFNNPVGTIVNTKTRIPNLYLTGQNIIFHGILGATIGAFVTCFNFIDYDKTVGEINTFE